MSRVITFFLLSLVAVLLPTWTWAASMQPLEPTRSCTILRPIPPPTSLYRGADDDARATPFDPADESALVKLDRRLLADPADVDARVARGYAHARRGERASSDLDFRQAWQLAPDRTRIGWSEGWALFSLGDPACAIDAWQRAGSLQGGDAFWLPYTLAMGYWAAGEKDIAVAYYHAAARSAPERFGTLDAVNAYTQHWAPDERRTINEIATAAGVQPAERLQPPNWFPWLR